MAPRKENNQIGKVPTSCSVWHQVLDLSTLQKKMEVFGSSSSFLFLSFLLSFSFLSSLFSGLFSLGSPPSPQLTNCSLLTILDSFQHKPLSLDMFSNMHDTWPKLRHVSLMQNSSHYNACIHKVMTLGHSSAKCPQF